MIVARASKPSRGMTVVAVLVCLIILTLISGAVLKVGVAQRELARSQERRLQAEWLAESGAERAIARLARDRDYAGETWSRQPADLGQSERAAGGTSPTRADERPPGSRSRSSACRTSPIAGAFASRRTIPSTRPARSRHTKEIMIDLEPSQSRSRSMNRSVVRHQPRARRASPAAGRVSR